MSEPTTEQLICPWCEEHGLVIRYTSETVRNGPGRVHYQGYYAGCSYPQEFNCPDTTGIFKTEKEAYEAAKESRVSSTFGENR